ncbi:MAG TPA: PDZ domain-containing protein [Acidimicrobiia bacterium]
MNDDGSRDGDGADDDGAEDDLAAAGGGAPEPEPAEAPEPWPLPPPTRRAKWPWFLGVFTSILVVASVVASFVQLPYYTIAPGDALDVNGLVTVHGARQYPAKGSVMLLFVRERSRINAWRWLQASLDSEIDLVKEKQFAGNADPAELDAQAVADMANSQNAAKYVAFRRLGYEVTVENKVSVLSVIRGRPAAGVLQPGDIIASIDGTKITTPDQLANAMKGHKPGEQVSIGYVRGDRHRTVQLRLAADAQGHPVIGVYLGRPLKFPIDVRIDTSDIGGPSAGLAMTLSILDELTPGNLTGAKQIAVTGAIGTDGSVLEVGGVGQKAVAARHRGAKLFIVPIREVAEARTRAGSMPVVGVRTLADALQALRAVGGDPLPVVHSRAAA